MDKLTIFYNQRTGTIKELCSGEQTMDWYGNEKEDYIKIFDFLVVEFDSYILDNYMNMEIVDGKVKLKQPDVPGRYL